MVRIIRSHLKVHVGRTAVRFYVEVEAIVRLGHGKGGRVSRIRNTVTIVIKVPYVGKTIAVKVQLNIGHLKVIDQTVIVGIGL